MTRGEIRRLARQAGINFAGGFAVVAECVTLDEFERFAALVAAAEREEIAAEFEKYAKTQTRNNYFAVAANMVRRRK